MAVCSFAGHKEVYDADMASKMQTEVDRLVKENVFGLPSLPVRNALLFFSVGGAQGQNPLSAKGYNYLCNIPWPGGGNVW